MDYKMNINPEKYIYEVREEFKQLFPYLSIEFFSFPHKKGEMSPPEFMIDGKTTFGELGLRKSTGSITIRPEMTVAELEKAFKQKFGLSAQVFRHIDNTRIETTATDGWTLREQNLEGKALST